MKTETQELRAPEKPFFSWNDLKRVRDKIGKVNSAILLLLFGIGVLLPEAFFGSIEFTFDSLLGISPFLALSVGTAAYIKATGADKIVGKVFSGHPAVVILVASIFGALSPFCSCGVIPLIAALLSSGVPLAGVMAFWISSPAMDPEMFFLTAGALGGEFALAKTLATMGLGMLAGYSTWALQSAGMFGSPLRDDLQRNYCSASIKSKKVQWKFWKESERTQSFGKEVKKTGSFLLQWMTFAFILESLMIDYLPAGDLVGFIGETGVWSHALAALIGVPAYMNGYAAIPLAAGLIESGFEPGLILTFMLAGSITSVPAGIAVYSLVKRPVFAWYLFLAFIGSVLSGLAFQWYL